MDPILVETVPDDGWRVVIDTAIYVAVCYEGIDHQPKGR